LAEIIPNNFRVLDVGCGDGLLARFISLKRPDITLTGIDLAVRDGTHIPIGTFDGEVIPYKDASVDGVMLVDVLHHTRDLMVLLREALRVAHKAIIIKDHLLDGRLSELTLRFMDKVGNSRHGVSLPYNYWAQRRWVEAFDTLSLQIGVWRTKLGLYPWPASWMFDRSLHFVARLDVPQQHRDVTSPKQ
jgi:SAM-dependent methyltransferase